MPETIKVVKFKTNVSFVDSGGIFRTGGSVVQLPAAEYDAQVDVCEQFGLPAPELIEEIETVAQPNQDPADEKPKGRGKKDEKSEGDESEL